LPWHSACRKLRAMPLTDKQRATLEAMGVHIVEMKPSATNDNARDAQVGEMDTAEYKRGGATGWRRSRAVAVRSGVGRTAEGNAALGENSAGWAVTTAVALAIIVLVLEWVILVEAAGE
jgi:hypothetical protein